MRYSYYRTLLDVERQQRGDLYGWWSRLRHLTWLTVVLLGLYVACKYNMWRHPRPVHHVWIDSVLVEVVEEGWVDTAQDWILYCGLCCGTLRVLLHCIFFSTAPCGSSGATATVAERMPGGRAESSAAANKDRTSLPYPRKEISTIAVPAWARRRCDGHQTRGTNSAAPADATAATTAAAALAERRNRFDPMRPMRTEKDLEWFLACEAAPAPPPPPQQAGQQQHQQRRSLEPALSASAALRCRDKGSVAALAIGGVDSVPVDAAERDVISVLYEKKPFSQGGRNDISLSHAFGSPTPAPASSSIPWAELGIFHLEEALQRTREWISDLCRRLIADVEQCDRWFSEHQIDAYDCHHSLQELLPALLPPPQPVAMNAMPAMRWGSYGAAPAPSTAPAPQYETKLAALLREKGYCRQTQQGMRGLDTALRYDQRLALEARLDVSGTFPSSAASRPSNADLTACREYVLERLQTFAKQRYLTSYDGGGGDVEAWRSGFPCDAHLLLHVLRTSVKGLSEYVLFGYQTGMQSPDLALYVGDTGEPYFYVRLRQGSSETLLSTRQGPTSLLEAILAFAAVVHVYYRDVYGGVRRTVDLKEVGLLKVVTEGRRVAWANTAGEW
ncbi:hypothetical protein JKF63_07081 [Porcisia hertigi]|uniref:Uncharacterized protein n=1 Tax=Porcisia hertigi TaxID=2761500 RepID=A0A836YIJ1_9TRYP|nr:hypothetical protein JKF63_07081 [Porcisia hertigi]